MNLGAVNIPGFGKIDADSVRQVRCKLLSRRRRRAGCSGGGEEDGQRSGDAMGVGGAGRAV
jgi:hypothetical protein